MLELRVKTSVDKSFWERQVMALHGLCFHQYDWSMYSKEKYQSTLLYFLLENQGVFQSIGFAHLLDSQLAGVSLCKRLFFSSLPASRDENSLKQMLENIVVFCRKNGIVELNIGTFGTPDGSEILPKLGFSIKKRWEFLLNIDLPEDELWMSFKSRKRNKIKKGIKAGWKIIRANTLEQILQFRELALETKKRKNEQGIAFAVADEREYRLLKDSLIDVGLGRLYLALDVSDNPVAGAFFAGSRESAVAYYMLSSSNQDGLKGAAPDLILWRAISDFQKDGFRLFNFGGVSETELEGQPLETSGLYTFKKNFSPEVSSCCKGTLILRPLQKTFFNSLSAVKKAIG